MKLYDMIDGKFQEVGVACACSIHDMSGPSYVHIHKERRERYGLSSEPYDWLFDTYREALEWAQRVMADMHIGF